MLTDRWDLGAAHFVNMRCESPKPVDDLIIQTSDGGQVFIQAKHSISLSDDVDSEFGRTIEQFVRQYQKGKPSTEHRENIPLNHRQDRLVLMVGPKIPQTLKFDLAVALHKVRHSLELDANHNNKEVDALKKLKKLLIHYWNTEKESPPPGELELAAVLKLIWVDTMDFDVQRDHKLKVLDEIKSHVVRDPKDNEICYDAIKSEAIYAV